VNISQLKLRSEKFDDDDEDNNNNNNNNVMRYCSVRGCGNRKCGF
jgi:hypothetical protein